jgi:hypothetical protein
LTPYWYGLGPTNEQLHSVYESWLLSACTAPIAHTTSREINSRREREISNMKSMKNQLQEQHSSKCTGR